MEPKLIGVNFKAHHHGVKHLCHDLPCQTQTCVALLTAIQDFCSWGLSPGIIRTGFHRTQGGWAVTVHRAHTVHRAGNNP